MSFSPMESPGDLTYFEELMQPTLRAWTHNEM
jgi:hypothetical protein